VQDKVKSFSNIPFFLAQVLSMERRQGWSVNSSEPVILGKDYQVPIEDGGSVTFLKDTQLPAVAAVGPDQEILFLGADFQFCVVDGPKVIMHKQSIMSSDTTPFLVTSEGALPMEGVTYPCQVKMESGHQYMLISPNNIMPLKMVLGMQDISTAPPTVLQADAQIDPHLSGMSNVPDEPGGSVQTTSSGSLTSHEVYSQHDPLRIHGTEPPMIDVETTASGSDEPSTPPPASASMIPEESSAMDQSGSGIFKKLVPSKHIPLSSIASAAPWMEEFTQNYNDMFLSKLSPHLQKPIISNETFSFARDNLAVLDELMILVVKLSGNHKPCLKICEFLAQMLAQKHPLEYGTVEVARDESGREDTLASERHRGGVKGNANLGKRLHSRYYEVFQRRRNEQNRVDGTVEEPEKKNPRGRPKLVRGIDPHKLSPKLSPAEKTTKTKMLEDAESLDFEARCQIYQFDQAGSLVQHQMYAQSLSAAKASAPSFFQTSVHLQQLFHSISFQTDIFEQSRKSLKSEMSIMEEYILDELPAGQKTQLIASMHHSKEKPNEHVLCILQLLATIWEQDLDRVVFVTEKEEDCLKDCPEPHLVVPMGDVTQIALFVDHTKIFSCMDWQTAIASLIAVHYLANLQYGEGCMLLKTYLQQEVCGLGKDNAQTKKKGLTKLNLLQTKKRDILKRKYRTSVSDRILI
jgi:hypothetical protein